MLNVAGVQTGGFFKRKLQCPILTPCASVTFYTNSLYLAATPERQFYSISTIAFYLRFITFLRDHITNNDDNIKIIRSVRERDIKEGKGGKGG